MGNLITRETNDLQLKIDVTKKDISEDYDLSTIEGVTKANEELMNAFYDFSNEDLMYIRSQLFKQIKKNQAFEMLKCVKRLKRRKT